MSESKTPKEKELSSQNVWPYYNCLSFEENYELVEDLGISAVYEQGTLERLKNKLSLMKQTGEDGTDELATQIIKQEAKLEELKEKIREMKKKKIERREEEEYMEELREEARKLINSL